MKILGFKPKHLSSIFGLLVAILLLGNPQFGEADARDVSAYVDSGSGSALARRPKRGLERSSLKQDQLRAEGAVHRDDECPAE